MGAPILGRRSRKSKPRLSQLQRELVVQAYHTCGSVAETARQTGIHATTVSRILRESETDPTLRAARTRALGELAGKVHQKAETVLDSIGPVDLEVKDEPIFGKDGNIIGYRRLGPTLRDKAYSFSLLADRVTALQQARNSLSVPDSPSLGDAGLAGLLLPDNIEDTRRQIVAKVRRLRLLDIEFREGETSQRIDVLKHKSGVTDDDMAEAEDGWFD
jgi:hypothetical protein